MSARDLTHYQRNLPHRLPAGNYIFVTFRLAGSLPRQVIEQLQVEWQTIEDESKEEKYARQKRYFGRYDHLLDGAGAGPTWLRKTEIAQIVADAIQHYQAKKAYRLVCYCLMPNHVHMVVDLPEAAPSLSRTLQYLKGYTAQKANALLRRTGQFWHRESYDHVVRNAEEMERIVSYVLENPVKAGLVTDWQQWPYTYWESA